MIAITNRLLSILFILIVGFIFLFFWTGSQPLHTPTPEEVYETAINEKVTNLLNIIIEPHSFYVNTTIYLRQNEKRILNHKKTPRSVLYERETLQSNIETMSNESPSIKQQTSKVDLPGLSDIITETKQYQLTNQTTEERLSLQEQNKSNVETIEEIYYDEKESETIHHKHSIKQLHVMVLINPEKLALHGLTLKNVELRLSKVLPIVSSRGDTFTIEEKQYDFNPPFYIQIKEWLVQHNIPTIIKVIFWCILISFIIFIGIKAFLLYLQLRQQNNASKQAAQKKKPEQINSPNNEPDIVIDLNKQVIGTIESSPDKTKQVLDYWMEQHHASK